MRIEPAAHCTPDQLNPRVQRTVSFAAALESAGTP
jgi:hypothetical protein